MRRVLHSLQCFQSIDHSMPRTPRSYKKNADDRPVPVKATEAEMTRRINDVYKLLVLGYDRPYILQYASETWKASERSADDYMARARALIDAQAGRDREEHLKIALSRLDMIFGAAYVNGDYKDALGAQHQVNKIIGLYAPVNQTVTLSGAIDVKAYKGISPDDWDEPTATED
jgi:hypothetical protein